MDRQILDIVNDFSQWRGNSFTLAKLIAELVKETAATKAEELEGAEIAQAIRGL
jgi:hypothetical protein